MVGGGEWVVVRNLTLRKFIEKGYHRLRPTEADFELHLSTIFTDARFKQYLEVRGIDGQRKHMIPAVYAFWKGILYDGEARRLAKSVLSRFTEREIKKLHRDVERLGLRAEIRSIRVLELARELVRISEAGLKREACFNDREEDERIYLTPLKEEVLRRGTTPAETTERLWNTKWNRNPKELIRYFRI